MRGKSVLENVRNFALQPTTNLLQRLQGHVLLRHLHPVQGRVGNASFARELLESQITPAFAEELSQLLCQSICHDWDFAADAVPQVG